jgi:hypothetical protein
MMRHIATARRGGPRRRISALLIALSAAAGLVLMSAGAAFAYFTATDSSNPAAALAATLAAPGGGAQNGAATTSSIPIKWTAPAGYTPTSYTVLRCTGTCTPSAADVVAKGGCSGPITSTGCADTDPALQADTTYTYGVEANLYNWISPADTFQASTSSTVSGGQSLAFIVQPRWYQHIRATGRHDTFAVVVAVESSNGAIAGSDNSSTVALAINHNPGDGTLTCASSSPGLTATVSRGLAVFTGCNINKAGWRYTLTATSPGMTSPANAHSFDIIAGPAAKLAFTSAAVSGVASSDADLGPITVQLQDSDGNAVDAGFFGLTVNLASNPSSGAVFARAQDGTPAAAVTIRAGSDSASFFFGDSKPGSPVITAGSLGLTSATQTETIALGMTP